MFQPNTVFVLGAGASHEVGLPLGSELKRIIANKLDFEYDSMVNYYSIVKKGVFMFGLGGGEFVFIFMILFVPILIISALVDILRSEFKGNNNIVWFLVVLFLPFLGSLLNFGIGRSQKTL